MRNAPRAAMTAAIGLLWLSQTPSAVAQASQNAAQNNEVIALEEVLVTAQKRTESLQDTPIALDAFSESALEREGINNVGDLANNVPALTIEPFPINNTQLRIYIRGIGLIDAQVTQDPPVGVYIDGAYIARSSGLATDVADLTRIEVLRGPQGTLYGRNSTGGAVNLITRRPNPEALEIKHNVTTGNRDLKTVKTSVNVPLGKTAAVKLAYLYKDVDGFIDNYGPGGEYGNKDIEGWRVDFSWDVNDWLRIDYGYDYSEVAHFNYGYTEILPSTDLDTGNASADAFQNQIRAGARQFFNYPGYDSRPSRLDTAVPLLGSDTEIEGQALTFSFSLSDELEMKYIVADRSLFDGAAIDLANGSFSTDYRLDNNAYFGFDPDGPAFQPIRTTQMPDRRPELDQSQFSHELQFSGSVWDGRLSYITGLYYFEEDAVEDNEEPHHQLTSPLANTGQSVEVTTSAIQTIENSAMAVFTQLSWTPPILEDRLTLTLGARHSEDNRKATINKRLTTFLVNTAGAGTRISDNSIAGAGDRDFKDDSFSWIIEYDLSSEINLYLKQNEAYKSGGFNIREPVTPEGEQRFNNGFDEEKVRSWEIGMKAQFFDNRLRINGDVFLTEFEDQQLNFSIPGSLTDTSVANAGTSELSGAELDITWLAARGLILVANYAYLDSEIDPSVNPLTNEVDDGFVFNSTPRHAYAAAIDWSIGQWDWGRLALNMTYSFTDDRNGGGRKEFVHLDQQPAFDVINARLGLYEIPLGNGDLTVALWGKNLENNDYVINAIHNLPQADRAVIWGEPRSYGLDVIFRLSH